MLRNIKKFTTYALILTTLLTTKLLAQDRVTVDRQIGFARGSNSSVVRGRVARGTSHIYRVRARAGQQMAVVLRTGDETSLTISGWIPGILEGADGVRQNGRRTTGNKQIGTDRTANYTLEVTIN